MKRKVIGIIAIIAIVGFVATTLLLTGCDNGNGACTHTGGDAATCTTAQTCTKCSDVIQGALGHQGLTAIPATCTTEGNTGTGTCDRCQQEVTSDVIPIDANAHVWGEYEQTTQPTCTANGIKTQACTLCLAVNPTTQEGEEANHEWDWNTYALGSGLRECQRSNCSVTAGIGHTGPAGGIIFHIAPTGFIVEGYLEGTGLTEDLNFTEYTANYLEVAPANMATILMWADNKTDLIPGLSQEWDDEPDWVIGRGRINTAIIIARGINQTYTTPAASACAALETGDKNDWFLPSRNELNALAQIRGQHGIPNTIWFWSSSQSTSDTAWSQDFHNGNQAVTDKDNVTSIRAIRAF